MFPFVIVTIEIICDFLHLWFQLSNCCDTTFSNYIVFNRSTNSHTSLILVSKKEWKAKKKLKIDAFNWKSKYRRLLWWKLNRKERKNPGNTCLCKQTPNWENAWHPKRSKLWSLVDAFVEIEIWREKKLKLKQFN